MTVHRNLNSRLKRKFIKSADQEDEQPRTKAEPLQANRTCVANQFKR